MEPNPQQAVFGLVIQDHRLARLTKRVMCISIVAAVWIIASQAIYYFQATSTTSAAQTFGFVALALLVPCCGYFGAKNSDQNLMCCYCGCNFLQCCANLVFAAVVVLSSAFLAQVVSHCEPDAPDNPDGCPTPENWEQLCQGKPVDGSGPEACWKYWSDNISTLRTVGYIFVGSQLPVVCLQCVGFWWGRELYAATSRGVVIHSAPQFATAVYPAQPGQVVQQARPV